MDLAIPFLLDIVAITVMTFGLCTSLAVLRPELPSSRWSRALHLPWQVASSGGRVPFAGALAPTRPWRASAPLRAR
jgi:hypothetical protein